MSILFHSVFRDNFRDFRAFPEAYLGPCQTYDGAFFCENSIQLNKMVKHTQAIRRLKPTNCLSVFDNFVKPLTISAITLHHRCLTGS